MIRRLIEAIWIVLSNPIIKAVALITIIWLDVVTIGKIFVFPSEVDADLYGYVDSFVLDAERHGVHVKPSMIGRLKYEDTLGKADKGGETIGLTFRPQRFGYQVRLPSTCQIYIKRGLVPEIVKKATVYHELGHCLLGLDHDPDPVQIMYFQIPHDDVLTANWEKELDYLFTMPRP